MTTPRRDLSRPGPVGLSQRGRVDADADVEAEALMSGGGAALASFVGAVVTELEGAVAAVPCADAELLAPERGPSFSSQS